VAETLTANYGWTKPDPGGSANTWGSELNSDLDKIDAQVFANETAATANAAPVGSVTMFGSMTPPTGWALCDGSSYATTGTYAGLFAVIGTAFNQSGDAVNTFRVPNLQDVFPIGAGTGAPALGATGGAYSYTIAAANLPAHAHPITDVAHNHVVNQTAHSHPDGGHSHGATASQNPHTHTFSTATPGVDAQAGSGFSLTGGTGTTSSAQPAVSVTVAASGANIGAQNANITLNASGTGLTTTGNTGGGAAMSITPRYLSLCFIIRYQ
jgi:microcystin-dependent protein